MNMNLNMNFSEAGIPEVNMKLKESVDNLGGSGRFKFKFMFKLMFKWRSEAG
jgi:hypothetical protein